MTLFTGIHFNTCLSICGLTDPTYDVYMLQTLKDAGCTVVSFEIDPIVYQHFAARYQSAIALARSMGFKIHLINQWDTKEDLAAIGLRNPLYFPQSILPPSFTKFATYEHGFVEQLANLQPDYCSVLAELVNLGQKTRTGYNVQQWTNLTQYLCQIVKAQSPLTKCWIDLIPSTSNLIPDFDILPHLVNIPELDGVGEDFYNNVTTVQALMPALEQIYAAGKQIGATETWVQDIWVNPQYDDYMTNNADYQSLLQWFQWLYNTFLNFGIRPGLFNPFFTNFFNSLTPFPTLANISQAPQFFQTLYAAQASSQRTGVFSAYQTLINTAPY